MEVWGVIDDLPASHYNAADLLIFTRFNSSASATTIKVDRTSRGPRHLGTQPPPGQGIEQTGGEREGIDVVPGRPPQVLAHLAPRGLVCMLWRG